MQYPQTLKNCTIYFSDTIDLSATKCKKKNKYTFYYPTNIDYIMKHHGQQVQNEKYVFMNR